MMYAGVVISVCNRITADGKYVVDFHVSKIEGNNIMQFGHDRVKLHDSNVKSVGCNSKVKNNATSLILWIKDSTKPF